MIRGALFKKTWVNFQLCNATLLSKITKTKLKHKNEKLEIHSVHGPVKQSKYQLYDA